MTPHSTGGGATDTHQSTTDPEAMLHRKGQGMEAKLAYLGHVLKAAWDQGNEASTRFDRPWILMKGLTDETMAIGPRLESGGEVSVSPAPSRTAVVGRWQRRTRAFKNSMPH